MPDKPRTTVSIASREVIIECLTACICCDEPDSDKYRAEVRYWLKELIRELRGE